MKIINGIINWLRFSFLPIKKKKEIIRRRAICATCEYNSKNNHIDTLRPDTYCMLCECNIKLKTASLISNCAMEYIPKGELKWEKFNG